MSDGDDGVHTLEAMASTRAESHAAERDEVQQVLDWAWRHWPDGHGALQITATAASTPRSCGTSRGAKRLLAPSVG